MNETELSRDYGHNTAVIDRALRVEHSFDVLGKKLIMGDKKAKLYFVDGLIKDEVMEKILEFLMGLTPEDTKGLTDAKEFSDKFVTYVETDTESDPSKIAAAVLSGTLALTADGLNEAILIDARTYPVRSLEEPDDDRVLRGAHDGFTETLIFNTALVRRRIRDPRLSMHYMQVGDVSKTDIVVCSFDGAVDPRLLASVKKQISEITIPSLVMGQESLAECLAPPKWYNPFPKIRYTERPDAASAAVLEGSIIIITDNSPSVMILPTSIFDFVQDSNDYYFPPLVGTYLRWIRIAVFLLTLLLTPLWFLLIQNPGWIPDWLSFLKIEEPNSVPILAQLLLIEFVLDAVKLASLNTPSVLSNSFSVVGALVLGEFAIKSGWFVPQVVLYMAFVAVATFTQPSFELGYSFKLFRVVILILTALFNLWGFFGGILLMVLMICLTKTVGGRRYLYPLIPFNGRALSRLLLRRRINRSNTVNTK